MTRNNVVSLPAAASQAAHTFGDQFVFSTTNVHAPFSAEPLDQVPDQAMSHVPDEIPPQGLPDEALDNMSHIATTQLMDHVPWLID